MSPTPLDSPAPQSAPEPPSMTPTDFALRILIPVAPLLGVLIGLLVYTFIYPGRR